MDFKVGQRVMLMDRRGMLALVGSIAIIERVDKVYIYVTWTTPQKQKDGAYFPYHFKLLPTKNQQLLFAFMQQS